VSVVGYIMAIKKPPKRAAATRNPPLAHRRNKLIQRSVGLLANQSEDALVDFIGDFARSATNGLPIYRISGGAGFVWVCEL
jgi:hypothetical protein